MQVETLKDLYISRLKEMHDGEGQLVDALSEMAESAASSDLQQAFKDHREETRQHEQRLETILDDLGEKPSDGKCEGIASLIQQGQAMIKDQDKSDVRDAGLIATAQQVEHFEVAAYGTLCSYAETLDRTDDLARLKETLSEEKAADGKLNDIALKIVNPRAAA